MSLYTILSRLMYSLTRSESTGGEAPQVLKERALKLDCNISSETNALVPGILAVSTQQCEKAGG